MISWHKVTHRTFVLPVALVLAAVAPVGAQSRESERLTRPQAEAMIRQVADTLRAKPHSDTLARTADTLKRDGANVATLRAIADAASTPLESSLAKILLARLQVPEVFASVVPYYQSDEDPLPRLIPRPHARQPPMGVLKPLALDLLHPDTRAAVAANAEAYSEVGAVARAFWDKVNELEDGDEKAYRRLERELDESLLALQDKHRVPREEFGRLVEASAVKRPWQPRLDPRYLPAWQEAMLRSDVTWPMKRRLLPLVNSFEEAGSAPILSLAAQAALAQAPTSTRERKLYETFVWETVAVLADRPGPESLFALADIIAHAEGDKQLELQRMIGKRVTESARWSSVLESREANAHLGASVRALREATAMWKEYEPTYHRGQRP